MQKISDSTSSANAEGEFTEGSAAAGVPATLITADWLNSIQRELLAVLDGAGVVAAPESDNQLLQAIRKVNQAGGASYGVDSGAANAYVVAFSPAITTLVDGMVLRFKAQAANTAASTLKVNGLGAKSLVTPRHAALVGGEIIANGRCEVIYNGTLDAFVLRFAGGGSLTSGRLIGVQVFTANGTYTPTPGTNSVVVEVQAGGGGGGASNTTTASQTSVGTAAHGGGYAQSRLTSGFAGVSVVVGAAGTGGTAGNHNATAGGSSSFGALLSATGGGPGALGIIQTTGALTNSITAPGAGTGGNIRNIGGGSAPPTISVAISACSATQSGGAVLGGPVSPKSSNGPGLTNTAGYGGGGGGAVSVNGAGAAGGAGGPGVVMVWEYA